MRIDEGVLRLKRAEPDNYLANECCAIVAIACAKGFVPDDMSEFVGCHRYTSLDEMNRFVRQHLRVKKRVYYKRGERPKLRDISIDGCAIICVRGHFLYLDHDTYYSFFDNEGDDVISCWLLE